MVLFIGLWIYGDQQDYYKRSGQIPAFGDWDYANELPITQYFECARQAGLIRFSSSSGESADAYVRSADLYAVNHLNKPKPSRKVLPLISIQLSFLLSAFFLFCLVFVPIAFACLVCCSCWGYFRTKWVWNDISFIHSKIREQYCPGLYFGPLSFHLGAN